MLQLGRIDLAGARRYLQREVPAGSLPSLLAASAVLALQRLVLPVFHWMDDTRAFGTLRPRNGSGDEPMTPGVIADSIVNLCGALGLCVAMFALHRRDPKSPLTQRLLLMLGVVAVLFFTRGVGWWTGSVWLDRLSLIPAALVPLGALIVTEGILRRHAPRAAKIAAVTGAVVIGLGGAFGLESYTTPYAILLALFQLAGFATCAWLLATRDRSTLLASENRSIGRLAAGSLIVIPFIVTDFQALAPDIPVRLGALGALLVVTAVLIAGGGTETRRQGILMTALRLLSSALLGAAAACVSPDVDAAQIMRFSAIAIAGVLTIGLMTDTLARLVRGAGAGGTQFRRGIDGPHPRRTDRGTGAPPDVRKRAPLSRKRSGRLRSAAAAEPAVDAANPAPSGGAVGPRHDRSRGRTADVADESRQRHPCHHPVA